MKARLRRFSSRERDYIAAAVHSKSVKDIATMLDRPRSSVRNYIIQHFADVHGQKRRNLEREIVAAVASGKETCRSAASLFGVHRTTVQNIMHRYGYRPAGWVKEQPPPAPMLPATQSKGRISRDGSVERSAGQKRPSSGALRQPLNAPSAGGVSR